MCLLVKLARLESSSFASMQFINRIKMYIVTQLASNDVMLVLNLSRDFLKIKL